ncbi:MAG: glycosyltransferase [Hyphomicrobiaceae bacterium]
MCATTTQGAMPLSVANPSPGRARPVVSVIVPHLDDLAGLKALMAALERQRFPRHAFEIIVADNGSRDGVDAVKAVAGSAKVVTAVQKGAGPARNHALLHAKGGILAFTDSDCLPDPDWLQAGVGALDAADLAGGEMIVSIASPGHPTPTEAFELVFAFDNQRYVQELNFSVTANLFARRAVAEAIGGFRTGVSEDLDWCQRAVAHGFTLAYAADAIVQHPARRNFPALSRKWRRLTQETLSLQAMRGQSRAGRLGKALMVLLSPAVQCTKVLRSPKLMGLSQKLGALGVLIRIRALRAWWMVQLESRSDARTGPGQTADVPSLRVGSLSSS